MTPCTTDLYKGDGHQCSLHEWPRAPRPDSIHTGEGVVGITEVTKEFFEEFPGICFRKLGNVGGLPAIKLPVAAPGLPEEEEEEEEEK